MNIRQNSRPRPFGLKHFSSSRMGPTGTGKLSRSCYVWAPTISISAEGAVSALFFGALIVSTVQILVGAIDRSSLDAPLSQFTPKCLL